MNGEEAGYNPGKWTENIPALNAGDRKEEKNAPTEVARTGQSGEGPLAELASTGQSGAGAQDIVDARRTSKIPR